MKKIILTLFVISALAAAARASAIVGADVGYLADSKEAYFSSRIGYELAVRSNVSHQLELEVGYTETEEAGASADLLPVTVNYRVQGGLDRGFGYYAGAGLGFARTRVDGVSIGGPVRLSDNSFAAQAFAGITYQATPAVTLSVGAKYIRISDVNLAGTTFEVDDDVALSAGISFKF